MRTASRAPDHQRLQPLRFLLIAPDARETLADVFEAAERELDPSIGDEKLARAREKSPRAPVLLAVISRLQENDEVSEIEQRASAGAALGYMVLGADLLGYAAMAVSGRNVATQVMRRAFKLADNEVVLCFVGLEHLRRTKGRHPSPTRAFSRHGLSSNLCRFCGRLQDAAHEFAYGPVSCDPADEKRICQQAVGNLSRKLWDNFCSNNKLRNSRFGRLQMTQ